MRGLKKTDTPILKGYEIFHNYLRPHQGLEGKPETKKQFKKLLDSIKNELPDDAERILIDALTKTSVEAIFYLIRLIISAPSAN